MKTLMPSYREVGKVDEVAKGGLVIVLSEGFLLWYDPCTPYIHNPTVTEGPVTVGPIPITVQPVCPV